MRNQPDPKSGSFLYDNYIAVNFCPRQRHSGGDPYLKLFEEQEVHMEGKLGFYYYMPYEFQDTFGSSKTVVAM